MPLEFSLAIGSAFFILIGPSVSLFPRFDMEAKTHFAIMKQYERITLASAAAVYAGYLIQQAIKTRAERVFRLAAGESPYERTHPKPRSVPKKA